MNNNIKTALSWGEQEVAQPTNQPQKGKNNLAKIEGILTSTVQIKHLRNDAYFWAFFQFEGIDTEIPVIFRIKKKPFLTLPSIPISGYEWPEIQPQSKVLLIGNWAESENSNRPSFTCQEYQILANPPPITIKDLREKISQLLTISLEKLNEWKQRVDYLFKRLEIFKDLEKLSKLGSEYLKAYLLLETASYANYQNNLLTHNQFSKEEYLTKISQEIEEVAYQIRAYQSKEK